MKKQSIRVAILVPLLVLLLLGFSVMAFLSSTISTNSTNELTDQIVKADIALARATVEALPVSALSTVYAFVPIFEDAIDGTLRVYDLRDYLVHLMENTLLSNERLVSLWTCWEPDAFDGRDYLFADTDYHDSTGRFVPIVSRRGSTVVIDALKNYDDPVAGHYYQNAKSSGRSYMSNPYSEVIGGINMYVVSYTVPILMDGKVLGAVGADFAVDKFIDEMSDITILADGYASVISHNGTVLAHPDRTQIMTHFNTGWLGNHRAQIENLIANGGYYTGKDYSSFLSSNVTFTAQGVRFGDNYWVVCAVVSDETAEAPTVYLRNILIIMSVVTMLVVSIVMFFLIKAKLHDLPILTDHAIAISYGDIELEGLDEGTEPTKNEVILLERAFSKMIASFKEQAYILARVAEGDYTAKVNIRSEKDVINLAIELMLDGTLEALQQVASAGVQVADGSKQIASGAQMLAQGATEQAATVEELCVSMTEIAYKTKENAEKAGKAANLASTIKQNAEKGSNQMSEMMDAVKAINIAGQSISKVIKVIDDIAFQTNILALNAAVEAARAGQHGKGFAVVAEEVRSLAAKSAEAAKDTGGLITNSIEKAELGSRIAGETAASLEEIVSGINESNQIVSDIATSSDEQYLSIEQINKGIEQVAQVVQQNSATAEESAAASEEMSAQSAMLENLITQFQLRDERKKRDYDALPPSY